MEDPRGADRIIPMTTTAAQPAVPQPAAASPPTVPHSPDATGANRADRIYRGAVTGLALLLPLLLLAQVGELAVNAWPAMRRFGFGFLWHSTWDPVAEVYGAGPLIFGTVVSSLLALAIAVPLALGVAVFLTEFAPRRLRQPVAFLVELLAAVPSVVYGPWGLFLLVPFLPSLLRPPPQPLLACPPSFSSPLYP